MRTSTRTIRSTQKRPCISAMLSYGRCARHGTNVGISVARSFYKMFLSVVAALPFGIDGKIVKALRLYALWPSTNEDILVENGVYSDLQPLAAPRASLAVAFHTPTATLLGLQRAKCFKRTRLF